MPADSASAPGWGLLQRWSGGGALLAGGLSALAMVVAFPRGDLPEAAYVALVPFSLWLLYARPGRRAVAVTAFAIGFVQWTVLLWWLRHFPVQVGLPSALGYLGLFILAAVLALFWVAWGLLAREGFRRVAGSTLGWRLLVMLGLSGAWVVLEWVRSWLFSGFPWLPLAASQWDRPLLLQILAVTGAWGLSFLLVLFNLGLVFYLRQLFHAQRKVWYKRFCLEFYVALAALFLVLGIGAGELQKRPDEWLFRAAFVQPYVTPPERWNAEGRDALLQLYEDWLRRPTELVEDLRAAGAEDRAWLREITPEILFWPEASTPFPAPGHARTEAWLEEIVAQIGIPVVMGNLALEPGAEGERKWYNAVIAIDPEDGIQPRFVAKRKLVPFGEAVPAWLPFFDQLVPVAGNFTPGSGDPILPVEVNGRRWRIAPLVCYEDLFPAVTREATEAGADFFFVATNDAWYGEEAAAFQHMVHSVLRAVETRRPVLRAGNAGWSGWIDERGYIRWYLAAPEDGNIYIRDAAVQAVARTRAFAGTTTPYVRWGDWFVFLSMLLTAAFLLGVRWKPVDRAADRD